MLHSAHKIEQVHKNKQSIFTVLSYAILSQFFSARFASSLIRLLMRPTLWNPKLSIGIMYSTGFLQDWWGAVWVAMQIQIQKQSGQLKTELYKVVQWSSPPSVYTNRTNLFPYCTSSWSSHKCCRQLDGSNTASLLLMQKWGPHPRGKISPLSNYYHETIHWTMWFHCSISFLWSSNSRRNLKATLAYSSS